MSFGYAPAVLRPRTTHVIASALACAALAGACKSMDATPSAPDAAAVSALPAQPLWPALQQLETSEEDLRFLGWSPAPTRYDEAAKSNWSDEACGRCHREIEEEWKVSMHRHSFTNRYYQTSLQSEDSTFCRSCHAPQARADAKLGDPAAASGIGCVTCHLSPSEGRTIIGPRARASSTDAHGVAASASLSGSDACRGCHEFQFPAQRDKMQRTHEEHESSAYAQASCQSCHMPLVPATQSGGESKHAHTDHRFAVQIEPQRIRDAVVVESVELVGRTVRFQLLSSGVGHAVPTGDLHRTIELRARIVERASTSDWVRSHLKRSFTFRRHEQIEVSDTRLPAPDKDAAGSAAERTFTLELPHAPRAGQTIAWEISWLPADPEVARRLRMDPYAGELVLHTGSLRSAR